MTAGPPSLADVRGALTVGVVWRLVMGSIYDLVNMIHRGACFSHLSSFLMRSLIRALTGNRSLLPTAAFAPSRDTDLQVAASDILRTV